MRAEWAKEVDVSQGPDPRFTELSLFLGYVVHLTIFSNCCKSPKHFPIYLLKNIHVYVDL